MGLSCGRGNYSARSERGRVFHWLQIRYGIMALLNHDTLWRCSPVLDKTGYPIYDRQAILGHDVLPRVPTQFKRPVVVVGGRVFGNCRRPGESTASVMMLKTGAKLPAVSKSSNKNGNVGSGKLAEVARSFGCSSEAIQRHQKNSLHKVSG